MVDHAPEPHGVPFARGMVLAACATVIALGLGFLLGALVLSAPGWAALLAAAAVVVAFLVASRAAGGARGR